MKTSSKKCKTGILNFKIKRRFAKISLPSYLPISLRGNRGSRYIRSEDGKRTLPCHNGEAHDAKFGTTTEQSNAIVQDYLQGGITTYDLQEWYRPLKARFEESESDEERRLVNVQVQKIFPDLTATEMSRLFRKNEVKDLADRVNQDSQKIQFFLKAHLNRQRASGFVISMDPQNIVDMSAAVSGVSATMGAPESVHKQFRTDPMYRQIAANMALRLVRRAAQKEVIHYNPEYPEEILKANPVHALIDGAGAFKTPGQKIAQQLKESNPELHQVAYHHDDETINFVGTPTSDLKHSGFVFRQPYTRGTDISLDEKAITVETRDAKQGLREFCQIEGRKRRATQTYRLAVAQYHQSIRTIEDAITQAACNDANIDAQDIFRKCKQELTSILRKKAKDRLLAADSLESFLKIFKKEEVHKLFFTPAENNYQEPGSYFAAHQKLRQENQTPKEALEQIKANYITKAKDLGIDEAVTALEVISYPDHLLAKMPAKVAAIGQTELEMELQVEQEELQEEELEEQLEIEQVRQENKDLYIPLRKNTKILHSVAEKVHPAYNRVLRMSDSFLPLSRATGASLHKRKAFDESMLRIGPLYVRANITTNEDDIEGPKKTLLINNVIIHDSLEMALFEESANFPRNKDKPYYDNFWYDIRLNKPLSRLENAREVLRYPGFHGILAQVKFLNGQIEDYTEKEQEQLKQWLKENDPKKMREHFLNQVLFTRYSDKQLRFPGSQLDLIFKGL